MNYYDQHLHTFLSFDSEERFENYLVQQPATFVATDHFDLKNPAHAFQDDIPDYEELLRQQQKFISQPTTFLKGIEIGVVPGQESKIYDYLTTYPYDLQLVSIHQNAQFDYMDDIVLTKDKYTIMDEYFQQMEHVTEDFKAGHILTHFEYGLRRLNVTSHELATRYEEQLTRIFKNIIAKNWGLELNAKSFAKYQNAQLYEYAVPLYQNLGGKLFTLGSDAHIASDFRNQFSQMGAMLKKFGVTELALFQNKEIKLVPIPES